MITSHQPKIRELLKQNPDGLTALKITEMLGIGHVTVTRRSLERMADTFIDRWELKDGSKKQYRPVWVLADVPENCPHPTKKLKE